MFRSALRNLLNLEDPPERTALAFSVGVFIAFSPLLGLHSILAVVISVIWRFNKIAIFTGTFLNNPWTIAPIVGGSWAIGSWIIGAPPVELPEFTLNAIVTADFWQTLAGQWRQLLPFAVGATILSVFGAAISYPVMLYSLRAYRNKYPSAARIPAEPLNERN